MKKYIATYGTLKKDRRNHFYLQEINAKFIESSNTGDGYVMFLSSVNDEDFPFLIKHEAGKGADIEIYEINEEDVGILDRLEGHPVFYKRENFCTKDYGVVEIYIYQTSGDKDSIIKGKTKIIESF